MSTSSLTQNALCIIQGKGHSAILQACQKILQNKYDSGIIREALHYYAKMVLPNVLPIFPALVYLSSNSLGIVPENYNSVAQAMVLITSSGDIHDDIVDNSKEKFGRKTVFGRFRKDISILAGDVLLIQGTTDLQKECFNLSSKQRRAITDFVAASMFEIVEAEALEISLWDKVNATPEEFFEVIRKKGSVAELHCKIGAIIGGGSQEAIDDLGHYGRVIGILSTLKEEFVDMTIFEELKHRIKYELPPYPMLCAMKNKALKNKIVSITEGPKLLKNDLQVIEETVLGSIEVKRLIAEFRDLGGKELTTNLLLQGNERASELAILLEALTVELSLV
jgi:geranylgeranyl pyrophosphate synthase